MLSTTSPTSASISSNNRETSPSTWIDYGVHRLVNPTQDQLRGLTLEHTPSSLETEFGSINKLSKNKARMAKHTYVISDEQQGYSHNTISRNTANRLIELQTNYIRSKNELIELQGWLGVGPRAVSVEWLYTLEGANIAGMQQVLAFSRGEVEADLSKQFAPIFRVVYTPDFHPPVDGGQRILVDLENYVTYVMGPDYFGESKKGALRMLCDYIYHQGGLVLHAGAKEVLLDEPMTTAILGLSGTGKTTTTFSKQCHGVKPIQDDMVVLWPNAELSVTENGCFAKTFGLREETEPVLYRATVAPEAWLENAYQTPEGHLDFDKTVLSPEEVAMLRELLIKTGADPANVDAFISGEVTADSIINQHGVPAAGWDFVVWTGNGRSIVPLSCIQDAADLHNIPPVRSMGILNRDEGLGAITPGIVRFNSPEQAAGYFMLGETTMTSAAGKERGRLRSPFTQPFFPREHGLQAKRFAELLKSTTAISCWLMNTGVVGGEAGDKYALKVKIRHSSAMLEALFSGNIVWTRDPDFGYEVVDLAAPENAALLEQVPSYILRPDTYYAATGRLDAYHAEVALRHRERHKFLTSYGVDPKIRDAVVRWGNSN
jgi:phosphoenolpyruvate carboxykinase (ATP)